MGESRKHTVECFVRTRGPHQKKGRKEKTLVHAAVEVHHTSQGKW